MEAERQMIDSFCKKLAVMKAAGRAAQLYTQLASAAGGRTHHPSFQHPQVKVCICIELAVRQHRLRLEKPFLLKLAGIPSKQYKTAFAAAESLLKVKTLVSFDQLGVQFTCSGLTPKAASLHTYYVTRLNTRQAEMGHEPLDLDGPLYKCAAVLAISKMSKARVNQKDFCSTFSLTPSQLDTISKDMIALSKEMREEEAPESFASKIHRRATGGMVGGEKKKKVEEKREGLLWKISPVGPPRTVYSKEFLDWKEKMLQIARS